MQRWPGSKGKEEVSDTWRGLRILTMSRGTETDLAERVMRRGIRSRHGGGQTTLHEIENSTVTRGHGEAVSGGESQVARGNGSECRHVDVVEAGVAWWELKRKERGRAFYLNSVDVSSSPFRSGRMF